jgi:hypothetical protein
MRKRFLAAAVAAASWPAVASAQVPLGPEFQVNGIFAQRMAPDLIFEHGFE